MSYVTPNRSLTSLNAVMDDEDKRRALYEQDLALQLRDHNTFPEGSGPVRGWGGGGRASAGSRRR